MVKLKNKINKETGKFKCGGLTGQGCGTDIVIGNLIHGVVFCIQCAGKLKGQRHENGMLKREVTNAR